MEHLTTTGPGPTPGATTRDPALGLPPAVVIGLDDGIMGLSSARALARRGVPVIALARDPRHYFSRTRVCKEILITDTRRDAFVETLERLGPTLPTRAVLIPCQDENVQIVSRHRARLEPWYEIALPPADVVTTLLDKSRFYPFAEAHGLPIPRTYLLHDEAAARAAAAALDYPCILKPDSRPPSWKAQTSAKAFLVESADELLSLYARCRDWTALLIAQEWIEGEDGDLYAFEGAFDREGRPLATFVSRKLRQWPPRTGYGCLYEPADEPEVEAVARRLFASVPYHGFGYVELKRDRRRGGFYIIEPNIGRPTGRSATALANGVDLVFTVYCEALGLDPPTSLARPTTPVRWVYWRRDLLSALYYWRRGELSAREWWRTLSGPRASAIFSWRDPAPFLFDLSRSVVELLGRGGRAALPPGEPSPDS